MMLRYSMSLFLDTSKTFKTKKIKFRTIRFKKNLPVACQMRGVYLYFCELFFKERAGVVSSEHHA